MIITTWNIRGFNKPIKHSEVVHFLNENKVDLLGLLETRVKHTKAKKILRNNFRRYSVFCNYNKHSNGRIWILWNPTTTKVDIIEEHSQVVHCRVQHLATWRTFSLSVVYGSNNAAKRKELWESMVDFGKRVDAWAAMGDFNVVRYPSEKISNTPPILPEMWDFNSCLQMSGLDDLSASGCDFTWYNKQEISTQVLSTLDRVLINDKWVHQFSQTTAHFLSPGISDHSPALVTFHDNDSPRKHFKFLNCWVDHPDFHQTVAANWVTCQPGNSMF
ncbi:uncharacterized protein LOC141617350 [Silene latifolia]|uniref:uncharacterized protein LOC141617350 n=1 Tax=Silene latifolia TaxID=37657 RepID=UPI003D76D203